MSYVEGAIAHRKAVRDRLMNPPNAVHDDGIDLKRVKVIPIVQQQPEAEVVPVVQAEAPTTAEDVERQIASLNKLLEKLHRQREEVEGVRRPTVEQIQRAVCGYFQISMEDLKSQRRQLPIVRPRQIGMWLSKKHTLQSFPQIGRRFGGRDHTTVLSAVRKINKVRFVEPAIDSAIVALEKHLGVPNA
jgi:chromosomal replication initiator protein